MQRIMFKSKLHRARITQAELYYEGSLTIDPDLMAAADFMPFEKVSVVNVNNGERFETYLIPGRPGSREICVNGAAARKAQVGDEIIIITYTSVSDALARDWQPTVVLLDKHNQIVSISHDVQPYNVMPRDN